MNKAGVTRPYSVGDKLPESTGDKLPTGRFDSTLLGRLLNRTGEWLHWGVCIPPGNNLRSRFPGMLVRNVCILRWGMLRSSGNNPTSLRLIEDNSARGECC